MTKKELEQLKVGTVLYNGHTEGVIKMDGKIKVIEVWIPIYAMNDDSNHFDERPVVKDRDCKIYRGKL